MSAESIEVRLVKIEGDIRRLETLSERFERIDKALVKLTDLVERQDTRLNGIESTLKLFIASTATKEEMHALRVEMHKEFTVQTRQFVAWVAGIAALVVTALRYWPAP